MQKLIITVNGISGTSNLDKTKEYKIQEDVNAFIVLIKLPKTNSPEDLRLLYETISSQINDGSDFLILIHSTATGDRDYVISEEELYTSEMDTIKKHFLMGKSHMFGGGFDIIYAKLITESHSILPDALFSDSKSNCAIKREVFKDIWNFYYKKIKHKFLLLCMPVLIDIQGLNYCLSHNSNKFNTYLENVKNNGHWKIDASSDDEDIKSLMTIIQKMERVDNAVDFNNAFFPKNAANIFEDFKSLRDDDSYK